MSESPLDLSSVALFPLPDVVLFPRAVLPLHIFEERYKEMTEDVLAGDGLVALALLRPGWEKDYYEKPAIEPVVCVGQILSWEKLPDGKYNFLLQGKVRARVVREYDDHSYRTAQLVALEELAAMEIDLEYERRGLIEVFSGGSFAALPVARQFGEILHGPLPTADIADLVAFNFLEDAEVKQALLEEVDVRQRVKRTVEAMKSFSQHFNPALRGFPAEPGAN